MTRTDRRNAVVAGVGALACLACCLFPLAIGGLFAGAAGVVFGPIGWIALGVIVAAAIVTTTVRRRRCGTSHARAFETPVALSPTRRAADR